MTWLRIVYGQHPAEWKANNPTINVKGDDGQQAKGRYVIFDHCHETGDDIYEWVDEQFDPLSFEPILWERGVTADEYMEGVEDDDHRTKLSRLWAGYRKRR